MKPFYFKPLFAVAFILFCLETVAQSSYRFESTTSNYTELNNAKSVSFKLMDNLSGFYKLKELDGELFKLYNVPFKMDSIKTFHIQPYANIRFDNDSSLIILDGGFTYLDSIDATSSISYSIEGNSGDKLVKVQWKNLKIRVGNAGNFMNVQIWVYQKSGVMEIHYGPVSANNQSGFNTSSGPQVGIFYSKDNFTKCYEKLWVKGPPTGLKLDSSANYSFSAMSGVPSEGVVFRFVPKFKTLAIQQQIGMKKAILFFPNPVTGGVLNLDHIGNYLVTDVLGNTLLTVINQQTINVSALPSGIYFIRNLNDGNGYRFMIE